MAVFAPKWEVRHGDNSEEQRERENHNPNDII